MASRRHWLRALLCLTAIMCLGGRIAGAQGNVIGGGSTTLQIPSTYPPLIDPNDLRLYTWGQNIALSGTGWGSNETILVYMYGPLNTLGVAPADRPIGIVYTGLDGSIAPTLFSLPQYVVIPYDNGVIGYRGNNVPDIPRPGSYEIHAVGAHASSINPYVDRASAGLINLCPQPLGPYGPDVGPNWQRARGGRDGFLGKNSPERVDPEWLSVWSKQPVAFYATVAQVDLQGGNQPAHISHDEYPGTHYAHDLNLDLVPDPQYRWLLSRSNFAGRSGDSGYGRIEWEWETQNAGNVFAYGNGWNAFTHLTGNIGIPLWASATVGDRVYTVGRWAMDNGHPENGDRTEIHPPRLLATMRQRNTAVPFQGTMTRASQVDVFVSGHGGGANQYYDGLEDLLDNRGLGGGRIQDFMPNRQGNSGVYDTYYHQGPLSDSGLIGLFLDVYGRVQGINIDVWSVAGPSGIATDTTTGLPNIWDTSTSLPSGLNRWTEGPEERPVNDMDYDFDVPLPPPPAGATSVQVLVGTHPEHTTGVNEVITYINPDPSTGLPTGAHIHLPYNGADSGIYARTLKFYWDQFSPPGEHFVVQFKDVNNTNPADASRQAWNLWTEVCGQWLFLTGLNPAPSVAFGFVSKNGDTIMSLDAAKFDVYLDAADPLRVFTSGYEVHSFDYFYGFTVLDATGGTNATRLPSYEEGIKLARNLYLEGGSDDADLGGALFAQVPQTFDSAAVVGVHNLEAQPLAGSTTSLFNVSFTITHVNATTTGINPVNVTYGTPASATVSVTSTAVAVTGNVTLSVDGSAASTMVLSNGSATFALGILNAGNHSLVANFAAQGSFVTSSATGALSVAQAPLKVTATNVSRGYGQANPTFGGTISGIQNGDSITATYATAATPASPVGAYAIVPMVVDPTNKLGNYAVTSNSGTLTVSPAVLTVTAANAQRLYGQGNPAFAGTITGIQNGDNINATYSTTATPASPIGAYAIMPALVDPNNKLANYTVASNNGTMTVNPAALTITANNATKTFNTANPALTWIAGGFVNGENVAVLTAKPTCTTTATTTSPVGTYLITCSGANATNYAISYVPGTLTVTCHYVSFTVSPSSVAVGGMIMVNATVMSCTSAIQTVAVQFALSGPLQPGSCGIANSVMFTTPPFMLPANTKKTLSFPFFVPKTACPGNYTNTATTFVSGKAVDSSSVILTVTAH
jgi:hypothetical protein